MGVERYFDAGSAVFPVPTQEMARSWHSSVVGKWLTAATQRGLGRGPILAHPARRPLPQRPFLRPHIESRELRPYQRTASPDQETETPECPCFKSSYASEHANQAAWNWYQDWREAFSGPCDLFYSGESGMKKKPSAESVVSPEIMEMAKKSVESPRSSPAKRCAVCGSNCTSPTGPALQGDENLCWVCRRLKISAWRDNDQQMSAQE
jgi:hypothetical protein